MTTRIKHLLRLSGLLVLSAAWSVAASDWPQWRGPERNSVSLETGLLQAWPPEGPKLLWKITHAGSGYSTPAVLGDRLYLLGSEGLDNEFVEALAAKDGQRLWSTRLGKVGQPDQKPNFPGARSTPTVDGSNLYALSSDGDLACLDTATGQIRWQKNLRTDFGGKPGIWAYAESPLVDGDTLLCTPGGSEATVLALQKKTGAVLWKCATPEADEAGYASAIPFEVGGTRQYVQLLQKGLVGIDAKTGKLLWRFSKAVSRFKANIPSPLAVGDGIYTACAGTGGGLVKIKVNAGAIEAQAAYFDIKCPAAIGGTVKSGDVLYGATGEALRCFDIATGKVKWEDRALGAASLCVADGRLYMHGENGEVGLAELSSEAYLPKGRFTPPDQPKRSQPMEKAWTYPVIAQGRLYLRDHATVWCYDIKAGK